MNQKLAIIVGNNFEEIEMVTTVDVLRRAKLTVEIVSLFNQEVLTGAHHIKVVPDLMFTDFKDDDYAGIILPGGAGVDQLEKPLLDQDVLVKLIQKFHQENKFVGAICAAPQVLGKAGILQERQITHFPGSEQFLEGSQSDLTKPAVTDQNIITGRSAGTAIEFALSIVEYFTDEATREAVAKQLVIN